MRPWARNGRNRYARDVAFVTQQLRVRVHIPSAVAAPLLTSHQRAKKMVESGDAPDSFMTRVLTNTDKSGVSELDASYVALKLIAAASDTASRLEFSWWLELFTNLHQRVACQHGSSWSK